MFTASLAVLVERQLIFGDLFVLGRRIIPILAFGAFQGYFHSHVVDTSSISVLVVREGFEPSKAFCQRIYSPPPLAARAPYRSITTGASGGSRTLDLLITNQPLWPTELHWLVDVKTFGIIAIY